MNKIHKEKYWKNPKIYNKKSKKWRRNHPNYDKEYYAKNTEKCLKNSKKWQKKNPDYHKEYGKRKETIIRSKKWRKNNPEYLRMIARKRRAMKKKIKENYTIKHSVITFNAFNNKCYNCKSTEKLEIDHHRPLSKGYPLTLKNAVILCRSCNSSKGNKSPEDFYGRYKCKKLDTKLKKIAKNNK